MSGNSRGFSDEEARLILADALAPASNGATVHMAAAKRWIPWLCAYTGARVGEIARLRRGDVVEAEGIPAVVLFRVTKSGIKAERGRTVPLHPHLVEQEFVEFARAQAEGPIFVGDGEKPDRVAVRTGERVRNLGIADRSVSPARGWRRRFITQLRQKDVNEAIANEILGYVGRLEWRKHFVRLSLSALRDAITELPRYDLAITRFSNGN